MPLLALTVLLLVALLAAPAAAQTGSVSERVDPALSGHFPDEDLVPPLEARWSIPARVKTVLAADGRVYVTDDNGAVAFDLATGARLWATGFDSPQSTAYESGLLLVRDTRRVVALDAATGAARWEKTLVDQTSFGRSKVVAGSGTVYAGDDYGTHALRASDGQELWVARIGAGDGAALDESRIYTMGGCGSTHAYDRATGANVWNAESHCSGGGDDYPALVGGRLYTSEERYLEPRGRVGQAIYDPATGAQLGTFAGRLPVFVDGLAVVPDGVELRALDAATGELRWRNTGQVNAVIAIGHDVYGMRGERLTAFSGEDGRVIWDRKLGIDDDYSPVTAAAPGTLLLAYNGRLTAWESALKPAPRSVALGVDDSDVRAGASVTLVGVLGRELRGSGVQVRVEGGLWPDGPFERLDDVRAARDGGFTTDATVYSNSRFRVGAPGEANDVVTVYAYPDVTVGHVRRGRVGVTVKTPRTRLAGRTLVLYRDPPGDGALERLGSTRLRAAGSGRSRGTVRLERRPRVRDDVQSCVRGQLRLGFGRPGALSRRCGARRISA